MLPSVVQFSSIIGYADDHTLLKVIPLKEDRHRAAEELNADLAALFQFGKQWFIDFAPSKTKSLLVSLNCDTTDHPPLFLNNCPIIEVSSLKVLGFVFDTSFTWGPHVDMIVSKNCGESRQSLKLSRPNFSML